MPFTEMGKKCKSRDMGNCRVGIRFGYAGQVSHRRSAVRHRACCYQYCIVHLKIFLEGTSHVNLFLLQQNE